MTFGSSTVFSPLLSPMAPSLVLDPPAGSAAWVSAAAVPVQRIRPSGDEILRYVDLSNVHVREAVPLRPPPEARVLLDSDQGPLLAAWEEPNRRIVAFAFDLHDSDLALQPAFPILMQGPDPLVVARDRRGSGCTARRDHRGPNTS